MNERIQELRKQAWKEAYNVDTDDPRIARAHKAMEEGMEKFAELIVRECAAALFDESERLSELSSNEDSWKSAEEYEIRSNQCIDDITLIEKHFGVEE